MVDYVARDAGDAKLFEVLMDILDTPVSPELLPAKDNEIAQKTEDLVGPYELHDFFLYQVMRMALPRPRCTGSRSMLSGACFRRMSSKSGSGPSIGASSHSSSSVPACRTVPRSGRSRFRRAAIGACRAMPACGSGWMKWKNCKA